MRTVLESPCDICALLIATQQLMDVRDVAAFLRVSKSMVYKLAEEGALPAVRIGRLVRFMRRDVDSFLRTDDS